MIELHGIRVLGGEPSALAVHEGVLVEPFCAPRIDLGGLIAVPALVDLRAHLRAAGGADAVAAAHGGYSDVVAMPNRTPVTDSVARVRALGRGVRACRVHPAGALTVGLAGQRLAPIAEMAQAGVRVFSDDANCLDDAGLLRRAMVAARAAGAVVAQHAQSEALAGGGQVNAGEAAKQTRLPPWPGVGEEAVIARDVLLAAETGAALHVSHVSTARSVEIVRWAKSQGWSVTAEVTPHHLLLDDRAVRGGDTRFKVNPPLRSAADVEALREGLRDGTIDAVSTDHAPHPASAKARDWCAAPFGAVGLETALAVVADVLDGDWELIARVMSHAPARIAGLAGAGRPLEPGEPATFALVDPDAEWEVRPEELRGGVANTPFAGLAFRHRVVATVVGGRVTADPLGLLGGVAGPEEEAGEEAGDDPARDLRAARGLRSPWEGPSGSVERRTPPAA
ncbi:dihydroorotase [Actinosynnema pretiosum]|uniref:Dihydroorotase n=1 Tax=Actinosynnema pretiosum TaxID=42197 RepID=A0A290ZAG2_9PSEU|nr:dihydroorotase [Actinosynnema pretiosum]ATE55986.1 dihydroorotase [Actinosynnema pretiosum]